MINILYKGKSLDLHANTSFNLSWECPRIGEISDANSVTSQINIPKTANNRKILGIYSDFDNKTGQKVLEPITIIVDGVELCADGALHILGEDTENLSSAVVYNRNQGSLSSDLVSMQEPYVTNDYRDKILIEFGTQENTICTSNLGTYTVLVPDYLRPARRLLNFIVDNGWAEQINGFFLAKLANFYVPFLRKNTKHYKRNKTFGAMKIAGGQVNMNLFLGTRHSLGDSDNYIVYNQGVGNPSLYTTKDGVQGSFASPWFDDTNYFVQALNSSNGTQSNVIAAVSSEDLQGEDLRLHIKLNVGDFTSFWRKDGKDASPTQTQTPNLHIIAFQFNDCSQGELSPTPSGTNYSLPRTIGFIANENPNGKYLKYSDCDFKQWSLGCEYLPPTISDEPARFIDRTALPYGYKNGQNIIITNPETDGVAKSVMKIRCEQSGVGAQRLLEINTDFNNLEQTQFKLLGEEIISATAGNKEVQITLDKVSARAAKNSKTTIYVAVLPDIRCTRSWLFGDSEDTNFYGYLQFKLHVSEAFINDAKTTIDITKNNLSTFSVPWNAAFGDSWSQKTFFENMAKVFGLYWNGAELRPWEVSQIDTAWEDLLQNVRIESVSYTPKAANFKVDLKNNKYYSGDLALNLNSLNKNSKDISEQNSDLFTIPSKYYVRTLILDGERQPTPLRGTAQNAPVVGVCPSWKPDICLEEATAMADWSPIEPLNTANGYFAAHIPLLENYLEYGSQAPTAVAAEDVCGMLLYAAQYTSSQAVTCYKLDVETLSRLGGWYNYKNVINTYICIKVKCKLPLEFVSLLQKPLEAKILKILGKYCFVDNFTYNTSGEATIEFIAI